MKYKGSLLIICLIICLFSIAGVCATDVNDTMIASEDQSDDLITIEYQDITQITDEDILVDSKEFNLLGDSENDNLIIDGNGTTSSSRMSISGNNVTLMNYNFKGLSISGNYLPGALYWSGNNGKIINCTFIKNSGSPGALLVKGANCTVINCTFKDNKLNAIQYGGAVVWNGANGTIINSNFMGTNSNNEGGAIYWCSPNGKVINCTFSNNYAWRGGAIEFGNVYAGRNANSENAMIINSTFINNYDSQGGGAIYTWAEQNIIINNCSFIKNRGPGVIYSSGINLIANSYFYMNSGGIGSSGNITNSLFYNNTGHVGASEISNSIFLNNTATDDIPYISPGTYLNFNWFGNTIEDYNISPNIGTTLENWLFLNNTHEKLMIIGEQMDIPFVFQVWDGTCVSDFDSSKVYPITLNLSVINGEIDKTSTIIGESILYNASDVGVGSITAKFFDKELTINLTCKNPTKIISNESITIYVDQFMNFEGDNFSAELIPSGAGDLIYSTDNQTILDIGNEGFKGINAGNANLTVEFAETDSFAPAKVIIPITVIKYDSEIDAIDTINLNYGESKSIEATLIPDDGSLIYSSSNIDVATVDSNGIIFTIGAGNATISVNFEGNRKYKPSSKEIYLTVNKIDSNISILKDIMFEYGNSGSTEVVVDGVTGVTAYVENHPEANVFIQDNLITVSSLDVGNYTLVVTTIPDNNHNPISNSTTITVNKSDSLIIIPEIIFDYGNSASVNPIIDGSIGITDVKVINHPEANISIKNNVITISNLNLGNYALTVTTIPDNNHNAVTNTTKIVVKKPDSSIKFSNDIIFDYGGVGSTTIMLDGATGITNVNVVNHPEAVIEINDNLISVSGLNEGSYTLSITTVPENNYNAVTNTAKITVKKYFSSIYFTNNLIFDYGSSGSTNAIINGATGITDVQVIYHPEAKIDIKNNVITVSGLDAGSYTLTATTVPDKSYKAATATTEITVNKVDSNIKFTKNPVFDREGSIIDSIILEGAIDFDVYVDYPEANVFVDNEGIRIYGLDCGNYELTATTIPDNNHNAVTIIVPFKITKSYSNVVVKKIKGYTASSTLKAIVKDNNGNLIDEGIVTFKINGKSYEVDVNNGVAQKKIKLAKAKTYSYKATFSSHNYKTKSASSKIVVKQSKVKLSTKKSTIISGDYVTLKATVKDSKGNKINEGSIKFTINGKKYKVNVKKGIATKKLKLSKVKTYSYKATFSSKYYASKTSTSKVIVKKQPIYTVKNGKYTVKLTYKEYKKLKNKERRYYMKWTGKYKYETKKYYVYKKVCYMEVWSSWDGSETNYDFHKDNYRTKSGWKYYGDSYTSYDGGQYIKYYHKYKKLVKKTEKKKVYMTVNYYKGLQSTVWTEA